VQTQKDSETKAKVVVAKLIGKKWDLGRKRRGVTPPHCKQFSIYVFPKKI
jgi:hypothetical protein